MVDHKSRGLIFVSTNDGIFGERVECPRGFLDIYTFQLFMVGLNQDCRT